MDTSIGNYNHVRCNLLVRAFLLTCMGVCTGIVRLLFLPLIVHKPTSRIYRSIRIWKTDHRETIHIMTIASATIVIVKNALLLNTTEY